MIDRDHYINDILQENLEFKTRLEEAEETLRAIRCGEIDGLVISGSEGETVFTLKGADHPYRMLIEEMNEGALTLSHDGTILYCNQSFAAMVKIPLQRIIGTQFFELVFPDHQSGFWVVLAGEDQESHRGEINLSRWDQTPLPVYYSLKPMWIEEARCFSLVITDLSEMKERADELREANQRLLREVVERKRAEDRLQAERRRLYHVLDRIPAHLALIAPDHSIVFANRRFQEEIGTIEGKPCYEALGYGQPCMECRPYQTLGDGRPREWEQSICGRDYYFYSHPFIDTDGSRLVLKMGVDITERRQMEVEFARLERLNLIGEMAASIGHEIRNPMTTIRGFLQMVNERDDNEKFREYYELMIEELDRANSIITEYLSMARDKAVDLKPGYLNSIIRTIYPMIQADANFSDKQIRLELGAPPRLLMDEKEIRQVILNLTRNGLEAMQPGGILTIRTRVEDDAAVLEVEDQGKGIPPELLGRLGTPFQTTKENGTGLGLAVCYSIVHRHKANMEVETGPGGTLFAVKFKFN